jgi:hypothetical protein
LIRNLGNNDNVGEAEDIYFWEYYILSKLNFDLLHTHQIHLVNRMSQLSGDNKDVFYLAEFFLELSLFDTDFYKFSLLIKASSAIFISRRFFQNCEIKKKYVWTDYLAKFTGFAYGDFKECLIHLLRFLEKACEGVYECRKLFLKYSLPEKNEVFKKLKKKLVIKIILYTNAKFSLNVFFLRLIFF